MSDLKRIDPARVPGLFQRFNMRPIRHDFIGEGSCGCCVNTILAAETTGLPNAVSVAGGLDSYPDTKVLAELSGLDRGYAIGLAKGWDDFCDVPEGGAQLAGYKDGAEAWTACEDVFDLEAS